MTAAAVQVIVGPTPIPDGEARAAGDITVMNAHLAFALAVDSAVPYGIPRGALIDAAPVVNGKIGRDHIVFADFIPNDWSAWPNTYHHVDILERSPARAVIRITRDWGQATITTLYTLSADADAIEIRTTMRNEGSTPLANLLSGMTLWPKGGYLFSVPGLADLKKGRAEGALSDRVVAYDEDWNIALHAPYFDHVDFDSKDLYHLHTLAPGESHSFEAWLQIGASGDLGAGDRDRASGQALRLGHGTQRALPDDTACRRLRALCHRKELFAERTSANQSDCRRSAAAEFY